MEMNLFSLVRERWELLTRGILPSDTTEEYYRQIEQSIKGGKFNATVHSVDDIINEIVGLVKDETSLKKILKMIDALNYQESNSEDGGDNTPLQDENVDRYESSLNILSQLQIPSDVLVENMFSPISETSISKITTTSTALAQEPTSPIQDIQSASVPASPAVSSREIPESSSMPLLSQSSGVIYTSSSSALPPSLSLNSTLDHTRAPIITSVVQTGVEETQSPPYFEGEREHILRYYLHFLRDHHLELRVKPELVLRHRV